MPGVHNGIKVDGEKAAPPRDLLSELRSAEEITGGPPPLKKRDLSRFLQQFYKVIQSIRRRVE
ncbi:MAG: DUF188 domain-containing protein [Thermodesulfobacteriota bacterium]|nr:DUF188 domain-containing protein [Thermodesulfobacteriota bacterium]